MGLRAAELFQGGKLRVESLLARAPPLHQPNQRVLQREFFIDNLLVRINFIIEMIWWTGLVPWQFEFPFPGSLTSTFNASCRFSVSGLRFRVPVFIYGTYTVYIYGIYTVFRFSFLGHAPLLHQPNQRVLPTC